MVLVPKCYLNFNIKLMVERIDIFECQQESIAVSFPVKHSCFEMVLFACLFVCFRYKTKIRACRFYISDL